MNILLIRFSSIGDIVMTSPVFRCLKKTFPDSTIYFVTSAKYAFVQKNNPYIDYTFVFDKSSMSIFDFIGKLRKVKYDFILDLHNNQRTWLIKMAIRPLHKFLTFRKLKLKKLHMLWKHDKEKKLQHTVDRYMDMIHQIGSKDDGGGLDYFFVKEYDLFNYLPKVFCENGYIGLVIGGSFFTRRLPNEQLIFLIRSLSDERIVLIGGDEDKANAEKVMQEVRQNNVVNKCGQLNFDESAFLIKMAEQIITNDTSLMHIAASFNKKITSIWGHNVPGFGNSPYRVKQSNYIQNNTLSCRPCSLHGLATCPKGHFDCMNSINVQDVKSAVYAQ